MANPEHVKVVKGGYKAIARWRQEHTGEQLDLSKADLTGCNFALANLTRCILAAAILSVSDLTLANLTDATLIGARLLNAKFTNTNFSRASCGYTVFAYCDLSQCHGLSSIEHLGPSSVGIETIRESFRGAGNRLTPELEAFFLDTGMPKEFLAKHCV